MLALYVFEVFIYFINPFIDRAILYDVSHRRLAMQSTTLGYSTHCSRLSLCRLYLHGDMIYLHPIHEALKSDDRHKARFMNQLCAM